MRRPLFLIAPACAMALVLWANGRSHAQPSAPAPVPAAAPAQTEPPRAPASGPQAVTVGLYLQNLPEIDIKSNSFSAEFYLWFRWKGDVDPTLTYQLSNATTVTDLSQIPVYTDGSGAPRAEELPGGYKLQTFHVYGKFGHPFPLARYPFDAHDIVISIEDAKLDVNYLVHDIDRAGTAKRPELTIPGWTLSALTATTGRTQFATAFGDTRVAGNRQDYSRVDFAVHIERPVVGIVSKTVIPIALILLITFGAFFCQPGDIDARLCLTITALISAVALQITAATELPPTGSLLLLDQIYILSYVTILAVTFCCIAVNRLFHAEEHERVKKVDRWSFRISLVGYFAVMALLVMRAH